MRDSGVSLESRPEYEATRDSIYARAAERQLQSTVRRSTSNINNGADGVSRACGRRLQTSLKDTLFRYSYFMAAMVGYSVGLALSHTMVYTQNRTQVRARSHVLFVAAGGWLVPVIMLMLKPCHVLVAAGFVLYQSAPGARCDMRGTVPRRAQSAVVRPTD